jgi:hypothetical protein
VLGVRSQRSRTSKRRPTCVDAGVDLVVLQTLLGHHSIQTTSLYKQPTTLNHPPQGRC